MSLISISLDQLVQINHITLPALKTILFYIIGAIVSFFLAFSMSCRTENWWEVKKGGIVIGFMCLMRCFTLLKAYAVPLWKISIYVIDIKWNIVAFVKRVGKRASVAEYNDCWLFLIYMYKNNYFLFERIIFRVPSLFPNQ